ncbi:NAD(P)/FAD-dependent oxidoreductase [uncultured Cetobacterium sp.]|uniref:phytoene desaturase family protein n=1 Tax=uncultured Cetobacterium sp. TaxID=527638 RepID=UPI0026155754|nr:phytoene desaturase family protein [uncultured Cetobacterium sp.]
MKKIEVIVVGAGPGGLATALLLTQKGYSVKIFEKNSYIGGRNSSFKLGEYKFDLGPTIFLMPQILEDIFFESGENLNDYIKIKEINPMYRLKFYGREDFFPYSNNQKHLMLAEMERVFPFSSQAYNNYIERENKKFSNFEPSLKLPYLSFKDYFKPNFLKMIPYLDLMSSPYKIMRKYFKQNDLKIAFTFQTNYIGLSPWITPGAFTFLSFLEYKYGVHYIEGGLNKLSEVMSSIIKKQGGKILINNSVKKIIFEDKKAVGIKLENGEVHKGDYVVVNADFATAMSKLVPKNIRTKYSDKNLERKKYSCSAFMLYLGVNKAYPNIPHHNIIFAKDYKKNVNKINDNKDIGGDFSFYIQNPSVTDSTLAPKGKSSICVLVPVANNNSNIDWEKEKDDFIQLLIDKIEKIANFENIRNYIEELKVITPIDWENKYHIYKGAIFNLSHNVAQILSMRPHNELEGYKNLYIVGGGTHPGSGLPAIYSSAKIVSNMIQKREYENKN